MGLIKEIVKKIVYGSKYSSSTYVKYLQSLGAKIDDSVYIVSPRNTVIDITRPYLLDIGKNVTITEGCKILTHGFDWSVLKVKYGDILGSAGAVTIKENCFIGVNSIIMKGVEIGPNVIIGAGSVVTKDIPPDIVAAGNPCRIICSLKEYYDKRKNVYVNEAIELIEKYYNTYKKIPSMDELAEFIFLFKNVDFSRNTINRKMEYGNNYANSLEKYNASKKVFNDVNDLFIKIKEDGEKRI